MGTKHIGAGILLLGASSASAQTTDLTSLFLQINGSKFSHPSDAVFVDKRLDALVTQQNDGKVVFFKDGKKKTVLDLPVAGGAGNGLLDIALAPNFSKNHGVYLYYTPALRDGAAGKEVKLSLYQWNPITAKLNFVDSVATTKLKKQALPASRIVFDTHSLPHVVPASSVPALVSSGSFSMGGSQLEFRVSSGVKQVIGSQPTAPASSGGTYKLIDYRGALLGNSGSLGGSSSSAGTVTIDNADPFLGSRDGGGLLTIVPPVQVNSGATFQVGSGGVSTSGSFSTPIASSSTGLGVIWNANSGSITSSVSGPTGGVLTISGSGMPIYTNNAGTLNTGTDGTTGTIAFNDLNVSDGMLVVRGVHEPSGAQANSRASIGGDVLGIQNDSAPDASGVSSLTINGLTLDSSILNFNLNAGTSGPMPITTIPALEIGTINIGDQGVTVPGTYTLTDYRGTALSSPGNFSLGVVSPAPEPSGVSLLLLGTGALLRRRRRMS